MKRPKPKDVVTEIRCPAFEGTGFSKVTQPVQPGRKIYPPPDALRAPKEVTVGVRFRRAEPLDDF
jgi:hypothetical protein